MSNNGHSDLGMAFAFLAGALTGAGLALLLAPKTGPEAREQVGQWLRQAQERAREMARRYGEEEEDASGGEEEAPEPGAAEG